MNPRTPLPAPVKFTLREAEVFQLMVCGMTAREVASVLFISPRTIHFHLQNIYEKLEVNNLMRAYHRAVALELLHYQEPTALLQERIATR